MPRLDKTLADYVAIAISPALIMLMVGSLMWFLVAVFYQGHYDGRIYWILACFTLAIVLIARIGIEEGQERATLFGVPLAIAVGLATMKFSSSMYFHWVLLGVAWWAAHKLTWDCTLIDEEQDSSGQGLLQFVGFGKKTPENNENGENASETKEEEPAEPEGVTDRVSRMREEAHPKRRTKGKAHTPGVWIVYFSLAALPLFGLGQILVPVADSATRLWTFKLLATYVAAGLGLLVTTSFLGLRRYLRQRGVQMPPQMAGVWIALGAAIIVVLLAVCAILPRPAAEYEVARMPDFPLKFTTPERESNRHAMGKEGAEKNAPDSQNRTQKEEQEGEKPEGGESENPESGGKKGSRAEEGQGNKKSSDGKSQSSSKGDKQEQSDSKQETSKQQQDSSDQQQKGQQEKSRSDDKSSKQEPSKQQQQGQQQKSQSENKSPEQQKDSDQEPSDQGEPKQDKSGEQERGEQQQQRDSEQQQSDERQKSDDDMNDAEREQSKSQDSDEQSQQDDQEPQQDEAERRESKDEDDKKRSQSKNNTRERSQQSRDSQPPKEQPEDEQSEEEEEEKEEEASGSPSSASEPEPSEPPFQLPQVSLSGGLLGLLKFVLYVVLACVVAYLLWKNWARVVAGFRQFLQELRDLWASLFGRKPKQTEETPEDDKPKARPLRPFTDYVDPFSAGLASRYTPDELVRYTFEATEAWARENGCRRDPDQTPNEFAIRLGRRVESLRPGAQTLARLYCQAAYAPGSLPSNSVKPLADFWRQLRTSHAPTVPPPPVQAPTS